MSKNTKIILLTIVCSVLVLGVGFWRYKVAGKSKSSHAVIVRDRSDSVLSGCDCTAALAKRAFGNHEVGAGSTVTITVTGDVTTAGEPKAIASVEVPVSRQVLEGRDAALQQRDKLLGDIKAQCEMAVQTKVSPIFIAIRRSVEHLRGLGCGFDSNCFVYVQSDLEETGDPQIKAALDYSAGKKQMLPTPIDNMDINIVISGMAETAGEASLNDSKFRKLNNARDSERADRIRSVWKSLFTEPNLITFEPYCPKN